MSTLVTLQHEEQVVRIPPWVTDLASFRRWATSDDYPAQGWYAHLGGELWVDLSMERLAHNQIKTAVAAALGPLAVANGLYLGDRMLLTHVTAELSTEPDGMYVSHGTLADGRVRLANGDESLEVEGTPDMVLEVVSPTSRHKDTVVLRDLYWRARVSEYWLIDRRRDIVTFDILLRGAEAYASAPRDGGWVTSPLFGKSFRLDRTDGPAGLSTFSLAAR